MNQKDLDEAWRRLERGNYPLHITPSLRKLTEHAAYVKALRWAADPLNAFTTRTASRDLTTLADAVECCELEVT